MRSRAARLTFSAAAWLSLAAAAVVLVTFERQTAAARAALRAFDDQARDAADSLSDLRVGQQAYVATGQGVGFWMPKVGATMDATAEAVTALRRSAVSPAALESLDDAAAAITELRGVDGRAREYLQNGQPLMAGDVIFTEGDQNAVLAAHSVEQARLAERQAVDAGEVARRRIEAAVIGAAGGVAALAVLLLMPRTVPLGTEAPDSTGSRLTSSDTLSIKAIPAARLPDPTARRQPASPSALGAMARLCTDFGRVRDLDELQRLLSRTAELMDASGVVIWMGDPRGGDLRPMLAHGYAASVLARMPSVPRAANNAAAAAYRTGALQIVLAKSAASNGAIVAPILTQDGCIGSLSAELKGGAEVSDQNQAIAALVAAHLASILAQPAAPDAAVSGGATQAAAG